MGEIMSYEVLEYIESDGYQYIDTGLSAPASMSFSARVAITNSSGTFGLIGTRVGTSISLSSYNLFVISGKIRCDTVGEYAGGANTAGFVVGSPFDIEYTPAKTKVNTSQYSNLSKADCQHTFYVFTFNNDGSAYASGAPQRLYGFKMWHGDVLVADYVPARKDGVCCMYDKVSRSFRYNDGNGEFTAGPRVSFVKDWLSVSYEGVKDDEVFFSAERNEGIDREMPISFADKSGSIVVERKVIQEGMREVFTGYDERFITADGGTFNSIKDGLQQ